MKVRWKGVFNVILGYNFYTNKITFLGKLFLWSGFLATTIIFTNNRDCNANHALSLWTPVIIANLQIRNMVLNLSFTLDAINLFRTIKQGFHSYENSLRGPEQPGHLRHLGRWWVYVKQEREDSRAARVNKASRATEGPCGRSTMGPLQPWYPGPPGTVGQSV